MKVYTVTVFENGDMTTSVWGVFNSEEKANKYKAELEADEELNSGGYYLAVSVESHEVK